MGDPKQEVEVRAAQLQHRFFVHLDAVRRRHELTTWTLVADAVSGLGIKPYQLREIARGQRRIGIHHIAALEAHFGGLILVGDEVARAREAQARLAAAQRDAQQRTGEGFSPRP